MPATGQVAHAHGDAAASPAASWPGAGNVGGVKRGRSAAAPPAGRGAKRANTAAGGTPFIPSAPDTDVPLRPNPHVHFDSAWTAADEAAVQRAKMDLLRGVKKPAEGDAAEPAAAPAAPPAKPREPRSLAPAENVPLALTAGVMRSDPRGCDPSAMLRVVVSMAPVVNVVVWLCRTSRYTPEVFFSALSVLACIAPSLEARGRLASGDDIDVAVRVAVVSAAKKWDRYAAHKGSKLLRGAAVKNLEWEFVDSITDALAVPTVATFLPHCLQAAWTDVPGPPVVEQDAVHIAAFAHGIAQFALHAKAAWYMPPKIMASAAACMATQVCLRTCNTAEVVIATGVEAHIINLAMSDMFVWVQATAAATRKTHHTILQFAYFKIPQLLHKTYDGAF